ncbi:hypothetical protein [Roseibium algae]|uniref:Uncharacterized protein n=1 Tax=Roseibium algae TaxID=3123038 RepID=A0ABU8TLD1_9HYPH
MAPAPQLNARSERSTFWTRVKAYVPIYKPTESLFEKTTEAKRSAEPLWTDARGCQAFLIARIAATGMGGR